MEDVNDLEWLKSEDAFKWFALNEYNGTNGEIAITFKKYALDEQYEENCIRGYIWLFKDGRYYLCNYKKEQEFYEDYAKPEYCNWEVQEVRRVTMETEIWEKV